LNHESDDQISYHPIVGSRAKLALRPAFDEKAQLFLVGEFLTFS